MKLIKIPYYPQETKYTCATACVKMILAYFRIKKSDKEISNGLKTNRRWGVKPEGITNFLINEGFNCIVFNNAKLSELERIFKEGYVIIVGYRHPGKDGHYGIVIGIGKNHIYLSDPNPYTGEIAVYEKKYFVSLWRRGFRYNKEKKWFLGIKKENK